MFGRCGISLVHRYRGVPLIDGRSRGIKQILISSLLMTQSTMFSPEGISSLAILHAFIQFSFLKCYLYYYTATDL